MNDNKTITTNQKTIISQAPFTDYIIRDVDDILNVNTTLGPLNLYLQNISSSGLSLNPRCIFINDIGNAASVNNITIYGSNGDKVNSANSLVINQNGANIILQPSNLTEWVGTGVGLTPLSTYKVYTALLSQKATNKPTAIVLENTLGGTLDWSYNNVGDYQATLNGAFPYKNKFFTLNSTKMLDAQTYAEINRKNADSFVVNTFGVNYNPTISYTLQNSSLSNYPIEIRVYD
jgi:hypothetical protein